MPETTEAAVQVTTGTAPTTEQQQGAGDSWETRAGAGGKDAVLADLAETRRKARAAEAKAEELEKWKAEREAADLSEAEKVARRAEEAERRAAAAEARALRYEVATAKAVPAHLLDYLAGGTREEIEASAAKVLKDFGAAQAAATPPPAPEAPRGPRPDPSQGAKSTGGRGDVNAKAGALLSALGVNTGGQQAAAQQ